MKNIENLMLVSKQGDFYSTSELVDKFNLNSRQLKQVMIQMGFEQARKYVINENGEKVRVRGYVCVVPSTIVEEEPTEKEFKLEQYTYNQMISMSDLMKKLLIGEIRLHYEELVEYYQMAKEEVFNDFQYLNDFANQF